jgi:uncharacterized protein
MFILDVFWSRPDRRLRALWRLGLQTGLLVASFFVVGMLGQRVMALLGASGRVRGETLDVIYSLYALVAVLASVGLAGFVLDRRRFSSFGFRFGPRWWLDFGFGLALGAGLMGAIFAIELSLGWITVTGFWHEARNQPFATGMVGWLVVFIAVGIYEETLSRGYHLRNLAEGLSLRPVGSSAALVLALLVSSVAFGLAHGGNPGASAISTVLLCTAGIQLGLGYVLTGELAIPIGLHIAWNFFQGPVFGFPVSGIAPGPSFIAIVQGGPAEWTGGVFGPEAGLLGLASNFLGMGLIVLWVWSRRGNVSLIKALAEYQRDSSS